MTNATGFLLLQTGTNAINTYAPTIFANLGIKGLDGQLLGTGVYGVVSD